MKTIEQARESWQSLQSIKDIGEYRERLKSATDSELLTPRSLYWKLFLLFETADQTAWLRRLDDSRSAYVSLRTHLLRAINNPDEVDTGENPLSESGTPRWDGIRQDETLRAEILQDVDRCMPENIFFREQQTHAMMLDILFIFCKLNPDVSYRQGMHELLAPVLWVVQCDAIQDPARSAGEDFLLSSLFDPRFIEHDSFTLFSVIMQNAKVFYEQKANHRRANLNSLAVSDSLENPISTIINRMFNSYLPRLDPELASHLRELDIVPQVFLVRWIRLLFGREFPFDDVLPMWDLLFAEDPQLDSVEVICLVMILRLRWDLLSADHNDALSLLLRYPPLTGCTPRDLVNDALLLKADFTAATARDIILKYTDNPVPAVDFLPDPDDFAISSISTTPTLRPNNIETLLSNTARNVLNRSEKWGINKALRDAVDEVKRTARDLQAMPTPSVPPRRPGRLSRSSTNRADSISDVKLAAMKQRNASLAAQLKKATDSLWECQRVIGEERGADDKTVKDLAMAVARVGFVQVYLEDGSIPLAPEEEEGESQTAIVASPAKPAPAKLEAPQPLHPSTRASTPQHPVAPAQDTPKPQSSPTRPPLSQSPFSWILGQSTSPSAPEPERPRNRLLFGEEPDPIPSDPDSPTTASATSSLRKPRERKIVRLGTGRT